MSGNPRRIAQSGVWMATLFEQFHVLSAAHERAAAHFCYGHFIAADVAPVVFANLLNCHVVHLQWPL